ncbi:MAG: leucine-rich repeat domain-containing protein [Paludibacteraceae bacterium]|nr:leucine-rich repeat domain-containing protein [Paludibacteraceae bacterium]
MKKLFTFLFALTCAATLFAYDCKIDGICYNLNTTDSTAEVIGMGSYYGSIIIPSMITHNSQTFSVTSIGNYAFYECSRLTSVSIPNSVTSIGREAFRGCCDITSITIPNSVTTIGSGAFALCNGLTSITIGNSVKTIGTSAFYSCAGLRKTNYTGTIDQWCKIKFNSSASNPIYYSRHFLINDIKIIDLVIPEGVDTIGDYAFYNCFGLTSVTIGNSVTSIGNYAFYECSHLTSVTIPNSVTTIGDYAFYECDFLTSVSIPNSVTTIGQSAFSNCSDLTSVTIPNSVTTIGDEAFACCWRMTSITCYAITPPKCGVKVFYSDAKVYVPASALADYQSANYWKKMQLYPIAAEVTPMDGENPIVTPTDQDVTIIWPVTDGTDTYTLTITKNGETVCVLTFNANGQLTNIAFAAPGHNGAHQAPAATLTAQGYQFTVTGLNPGTAYDYSVTATDADGQTLAEHKGNFSTTGGTGFKSVHDSQCTMHKYFHNGNLIIERNGVKYTPAGQKVW